MNGTYAQANVTGESLRSTRAVQTSAFAYAGVRFVPHRFCAPDGSR
jgi:hypothetical protein